MAPHPRPGSHRAATPARPRARHALIGVALAAILVVLAAVTVAVVAGPETDRAPAEAEAHRAAERQEAARNARRVEVAVAQTLVAATRLDVFDGAAPDRRAAILDRVTENLTVADEALAGITNPQVSAQAASAREALSGLAGAVADLQSCVATAQEQRATTPGRASRPACAVSTEEVATARDAGAAVAALIPYGTVTAEEFATLTAQVRTQALAEARKGSSATVTLPDRFTRPQV